MEKSRRKRKGTKSSEEIGFFYVSDDIDHSKRYKKKCEDPKESNNSLNDSKIRSCNALGSLKAVNRAVALTAPISGSSVSDSPCRGLKRKLGCVESVTRVGRKKKMENEYELGKEIGKGRFGSVRICRSKLTGEEFACKTLVKNGEETVHREVEIMQHISGHPGIVTLKAVFEDSKSFHLVMELCSGGRLIDEMAKEGRYSEHRAAVLIKELVLVIKYCHEMGVVHRDIKPENILLSSAGKIKLADFGLAVRVANGQKLSGIAGSPAYVAPEVLTGDYSDKVDIWGAGVLLHALLIGMLPFHGGSLDDIFQSIKTAELDFDSEPWQSVSELARDLVRKMLTRDVCTRITVDDILRHPWISFYTEAPAKLMPIMSEVDNKTKNEVASVVVNSGPSSIDNWSIKTEEADESGFVDALAAAISRVTISERKRSRICGPVSPIEQQCSSNMKANLCTAF